MSEPGSAASASAESEETVVSSTTGIFINLKKRQLESSQNAANPQQGVSKKQRKALRKTVDHRVVEPIILQKISENEYRVKPREEHGRSSGLTRTRKLTTHHSGAGTIKCNYCEHPFKTVSEMRLHILKSHFQRSVKPCVGCSFLFQRVSSIIQENNKSLQIMCPRALSSLPEKVLPMDLEVPDHNICTICNEVFKTVAGMRMHRSKIHIVKEQRSILCIRCNAVFPTLQHFKLHKYKCPRELRDISEIVGGNNTPHNSMPIEQCQSNISGKESKTQTNTGKLSSSRPTHSKKANKKQALIETIHSDFSHFSVPAASILAPNDRQHLPTKHRRLLPRPSSMEQKLKEQAPYTESILSEQTVKKASPPRFSLSLLRSLLLFERDKSAPNSYREVDMSFLPQCDRTEEGILFENGGNYKQNNPHHLGRCYKRKQNDQHLQNDSSVMKRKYEGKHETVSATGHAHIINTSAVSQFPLKKCSVVLSDICPIEVQHSLPDMKRQTVQAAPEKIEESHGNRERQDANCNKATLTSPPRTKSGDTSSGGQGAEDTGGNEDQHLSAENIMTHILVANEEAKVGESLPQNKSIDTVNDLSAPVALSAGRSITNSESSPGNSKATDSTSMDGTRVECSKDTDSQMLTDSIQHTREESITFTVKKNTLQHTNRETDISTPVDSVTNIVDAMSNCKNRQFPGDSINESNLDNEPSTGLATERAEQPLEGCNPDISLQYSHTATDSSVQTLPFCDASPYAEMLLATDTPTNSEVLATSTMSFRDSITQSASNHSPSISHSFPYHSNTIETEQQERVPFIDSLAQCDTDTHREIITSEFFDELSSSNTAFPDLFLSSTFSDINDNSYDLSSKRIREQKNNLNHFTYNEETVLHSTDNESCINVGTAQLEQTSENSLFPAGEHGTNNDGETYYNSHSIQETQNKEILTPIFDDNYVTGTSQPTSDEDEMDLKKLFNETMNQLPSDVFSDCELNSDSEFSSSQQLDNLLTSLVSPYRDCETKTTSSTETGQDDEALVFTSHSNGSGETCLSQRSVSSKSQLMNTTEMVNSDNQHSGIDVINSAVVRDGHCEMPSNGGSTQKASNTGGTEVEGDSGSTHNMRNAITDGTEISCGSIDNEVSDWLVEGTDTEMHILSDDAQLITASEMLSSDNRHSEVDIINSIVLRDGNYEMLSNGGNSLTASNITETEKGGDSTHNTINLINNGTEVSCSPKNNKVSGWLAEGIDTGIHISSDESQLINTSKMINSGNQHNEVELINSTVLTDLNYEMSSNVGIGQIASDTGEIEEEGDLTHNIINLITDGTEISCGSIDTEVSDWLVEGTDTEIHISSDDTQLITASKMLSSDNRHSEVDIINSIVLRDGNYEMLSNGGNSLTASNITETEKGGDSTHNTINLINNGTEVSCSPKNNKVSGWLAEGIDTGIHISSDESQLVNTSKMVNSGNQHNEVELINSTVLTDVNYEMSSNVGIVQISSDTSEIEEEGDLTHNIINLITDGTEISYSPNDNQVSDRLAESTDTETHISSDKSQTTSNSFSEKSLESLNNSGSISNLATDSMSDTQLQTKCQKSDWPLLCNNPPLFSDSPLNLYTSHSPDHNDDLTFESPEGMKDCSNVDVESFGELIRTSFPSLVDHDFAESLSAGEVATDTEHTHFEALDFDLLVASPPDYSKQIFCPEMNIAEEQIEADSVHNPEYCMTDRNKILGSKEESYTPPKISNTETVNGIVCPTGKSNMFTCNNAAHSSPIELADVANYTKQFIGSTEVDSKNLKHCNPEATEIITEGPECSPTGTQSPNKTGVTHSEITSTESSQRKKEMDTAPPDQGTMKSATDNVSVGLAASTPSCSTSQYKKGSDSASCCAVSENKENPVLCESMPSSNSITFEAGTGAVTENNIQNKAMCSYLLGAHTLHSTAGVSEQVNLSKSTPEMGHSTSVDVNIIQQSSQQNSYEVLQMPVSSHGLPYKTQSNALNPVVADQLSNLFQGTNSNPPHVNIAVPTVTPQKERQDATGHTTVQMSLPNATNEVTTDEKLLTLQKYGTGKPEQTILVNLMATSNIPVQHKITILAPKNVSLLALLGNSSTAVNSDCLLRVPTTTPQGLTQARQPVTLLPNNGSTSLIRILNPRIQQGTEHKKDVLTAHKQHDKAEVAVISKSLNTAENPTAELSLPETGELNIGNAILSQMATEEVQSAVCGDTERVTKKFNREAMARKGNLTDISNGKQNKILEVGEILPLGLRSPQEVAEGSPDFQISDLSHNYQYTEKSQCQVSTVSYTPQLFNKSQFDSRNANNIYAIQRNQLPQTSVQGAKVVRVQSSATSGGTAIGGTVSANTERNWVDPYFLLASTQQTRVRIPRKTTPTNFVRSKTTKETQICHCQRRFMTLRGLHQHQTRCHHKSLLIHEELKEKCSKLLHLLPNRRYECPCGSIFRSLSTVLNHYKSRHKGDDNTSWWLHDKLLVCSCKRFVPHARRPAPSSLHKQTDKKDDKEL